MSQKCLVRLRSLLQIILFFIRKSRPAANNNIRPTRGYKLTLNNLRSWYGEKVPIYKPLVERLENLVREILDKEAIEYVHIEARLKEFESFKKKIVRKGYRKPEEITDLAGVMIVGSVLSNAELISKKIKSGKEFQIDWDKSEDHFIKLAEDRVGYRGKNYVAIFREGRHLETPMIIRSLKI